MRLLREHKVNVDAKDSWNGRTELHGAAGGEHEAVARLLLEYKADIDVKKRIKRETRHCTGRLMEGTRRRCGYYWSTKQKMMERGHCTGRPRTGLLINQLNSIEGGC
jgi:hypothetical protein